MTDAELIAGEPNPAFAVPAGLEALKRAAAALSAHGMHAVIVESGEAARDLVLEMVPPGAEVHLGASQTLETIGVVKEIEESGRYDAVRPRTRRMDRTTQAREMRSLQSGPDYMLGSVHAVTEDGSLLWVSKTGSQLGPHATGAGRVIVVAGHQKVVGDLEQAFCRVREYVYPRENARALQAYGVASSINKMLIINQEVVPDRIHVILVRETLGF